MIKKSIISIILILLASQMVSAQEIDYPDLPSVTAVTTQTSFAGYVEYLYYFLIFSAGILALIVLIIAAFEYINAFGNPSKIANAKSRIASALLGLVIVLGAYVILFRINPRLTTFEMPVIEPLIDRLNPGVLVCKEVDVPIMESWQLQENYISGEIGEEDKERIRDRIRDLNKSIRRSCYYVSGSENIEDSFDNKIRSVWFLPDHVFDIEAGRLVIKEEYHYGAAVFESKDQIGRGHVYFEHMLLPRLIGPKVVVIEEDMGISSVVVFKRYTPNWVRRGDIPDPVLWTVELYEEENYNKSTNSTPFSVIGSQEELPRLYFFHHNSPDGSTIPWPIRNDPNPLDPFLRVQGEPINPKSMIINGEAMVILYKNSLIEMPDGTFRSNELNYFQIFFSGKDSNLEKRDVHNDNLNDNIVEWGKCPSYRRDDARVCDRDSDPLRPFATGIDPWDDPLVYGSWVECCPLAAADGIIIIGNVR